MIRLRIRRMLYDERIICKIDEHHDNWVHVVCQFNWADC